MQQYVAPPVRTGENSPRRSSSASSGGSSSDGSSSECCSAPTVVESDGSSPKPPLLVKHWSTGSYSYLAPPPVSSTRTTQRIWDWLAEQERAALVGLVAAAAILLTLFGSVFVLLWKVHVLLELIGTGEFTVTVDGQNVAVAIRSVSGEKSAPQFTILRTVGRYSARILLLATLQILRPLLLLGGFCWTVISRLSRTFGGIVWAAVRLMLLLYLIYVAAFARRARLDD